MQNLQIYRTDFLFQFLTEESENAGPHPCLNKHNDYKLNIEIFFWQKFPLLISYKQDNNFKVENIL